MAPTTQKYFIVARMDGVGSSVSSGSEGVCRGFACQLSRRAA